MSSGHKNGCVSVSLVTLHALVHIARDAGDAILASADRRPTIKTDGSPVTSADCTAQASIYAALSSLDASTPILAEEAPMPDDAVRRTWRRYWLVDPLDGTKEYVAGLVEYTVNIALIDDGVPVLGVVHAPALGMTYYAAHGLGSWRRTNGDPEVRLSARPPTASALRVVESRSHPSPELERFLAELHVAERIKVGSSLKFCWLADGRADCYARFGPTMAWDVAAGDCVFRYASPSDRPHASPLSYHPANLGVGPFVIGFAPPDAVARALARLRRTDKQVTA